MAHTDQRTVSALAADASGGVIDPVWTASGVAYPDAGGWVSVEADGTRSVSVSPPPAVACAPRKIRSAFKIGRPDVLESASPDGASYLTEVGHDLALRYRVDGRTRSLTTGGRPDLRWEAAGAIWSPDGLHLLVRQRDSRRMDRFPVVHWLQPSEDVEFFPAARVGGAVESTRLGVIDRITREVHLVDSGDEPEQDLRPLGWSPDSTVAYFVKTNRYKNPFLLMAVDIASGTSWVIHEERSDTWVSFWEKGMAVVPVPDGTGFIWLSERSGWAHLYRLDPAGREFTALTTGEWPVTRIVGVDAADGWVYFEAHSDPQRPYDTHIGRVPLSGGEVEQLSHEPGTHHGRLHPNGSLVLDTYSSPWSGPGARLLRSDGGLVADLATSQLAAGSPLEHGPEEFTALAADGSSTLYGQLYLPADLDPDASYPVVESIYAGPNSAFVPTSLVDETAIMARWLADRGFVVVVVDARGTPERSKAFHDVAYRNFAEHVIPDHVQVLRQLARDRPFMDIGRVGVFGRSYGGYFTARALLEAPDVYRAGVAINGVYELREGNGAGPIECVMGPLADDPHAYDRLSLYPLVEHLEGHLLLVHGTSDVNVPFGAALKFAEVLMAAGKPFDMLPVNEQPHHFAGTKYDYLGQTLARYFAEHLAQR
ncbi:MAG: DPP IV N-terminal domain-containing protein [Nostocoides sp.]